MVSIIIPAFNEEGNIQQIVERVNAAMAGTKYDHEIIFVNDGSTDNTSHTIQELAYYNPHIYFLEFSRNYGHQLAVKAGIDYARGDCVISMDCDMQHPPEMIPVLLAKWEECYEVVYTIRKDNKKVPFGKRFFSRVFYKLLNRLSDISLDQGAADFRLIDRRIADILKRFRENDPFLRGLVKWIGFKQCGIQYEADERFDGESKYTLKKMSRLALHGVMSFSIRPLYAVVYLGLAFSALSILYIPYVIYAFYSGSEVPGWASVIMTIVFFGGIQLSVLGIIGIYIGKLFMQAKGRPNYIISSTNIKPANVNDLVKL